jgi:hypothetical protein
MPNELTRDAKALLTILVETLQTANPEDPHTFITYSDALRRLKIPYLGGHAGRILQEGGLDHLAEWVKANSLPAITGLVVRDTERDPGTGFFRFYGKRELDDILWWLDEIRKAKNFDWSPYVGASTYSTLASNESVSNTAAPLTVSAIVRPDSRFFLKSEYGPLSQSWPVVAFTSRSLGQKIQANFRPEADFIVYTGTSGASTMDSAHRGRLLSLVRIDTSNIHATSDFIAEQSREWAEDDYPGQWENCFKATEGWNFLPFASSRDTLPSHYPLMGQFPNRGGVLEITGADRDSLLGLRLERLTLRKSDNDTSTQEPDLLAEARRITDLIFARVSVSGETIQRNAPERSAPEDLVSNIHTLLQAKPLTCYLCSGLMQIKPKNRLLQPSPDRIDSSIGSYGPENLRLAHLACNLGKNASSVAEFGEWLSLMRRAESTKTE